MAKDDQKDDKNKLALPSDALEILRSERSQVDINVLLVQVVNKAPDPTQALAATEQMLNLARNFEHQRVEDFLKRAHAVIDVKTKDPDEIDKRANNSVRRRLKLLIALLGVTLVGGGIAGALLSASIVVTGLMLLGGIFAIALLAVLASGESVSSNDVVRVLGAVKGLNGQEQEPHRKGRR